jgi:hypothetical protein
MEVLGKQGGNQFLLCMLLCTKVLGHGEGVVDPNEVALPHTTLEVSWAMKSQNQDKGT